MSQTSPNPAGHTTTDCRSTNHGDIKTVCNNNVVNYTVNKNFHLQPEPTSPRQQIEEQGVSRRWWQGLNFRTKAVAMAFAVLTLPVLANRTCAYYFTNQPIAQQSTPPNQDRGNEPAEIVSAPGRNLPLIPIIETVVAALLLVGLIAAYFANRAMEPVRSLATTDDNLGKREPDSTAAATTEKSVKGKPESADIAFARLATELVQNKGRSEQQEEDAERSQLLTEITLRIRQSLYLEDVLKTTVKEVRRVIKTDRVIIYAFDPNNWDGTVIAESVAPGWPKTLRVKIDDPCFRNGHVEIYKNGQVTFINNIYQDPRLTDCYRRMLEQFAVKANLVAPILRNKQLLGLMIAHQCSEARTWEHPEVDLFAKLATQVGLAVDQASFLEQQEDDAERTQLLTEITLRIRESLYLEDVLKTAVKEVRRAMKTDRVLILGLDPTNWDGFVVAESVGPGWPQTLRVRIDDPCLRNGSVEMYKNGRVTFINNIYQDSRVTDCYRKTLEQFAVKASLVAPILRNKQLLGLMIAHQCSEIRTWQKPEVDFFAQLATYVGYAVDKASLIEQIEQ